MLANLGDVVGRVVDVGIAQHQQRARRGGVDQLERRLEHGHAGALAAHQRPADVKAPLGQQLVEVVARDPSRDVGIAAAHEVGVAVAQIAQRRVDLSPPPARGHDGLELLLARGPDPQAKAVVGEHLELVHVVGGATRHHRVHPAGVVTDHPTQRGVGVSRGVGGERDVVLGLQGIAEVVAHAAGLHAREAPLQVHLDHVAHVLRAVDHQRDVAALAGQARAAPAGEHGCAVGARRIDRGHHVVHAARNDDADRGLPVVGRIVRVGGARSGVEAHLSLDRRAQVALEPAHVDSLAALASPGAGDRLKLRAVDVAGGGRAHRAKGSASARLSSRPSPGRATSGRRRPASGASTPSKSMASRRTWSWKYSRWTSGSIAVQA